MHAPYIPAPPDAVRLLAEAETRNSGPWVAHSRHVAAAARAIAAYWPDLDPDAARICLTHSFVVRDIRAIAGEWDCTPEELAHAERLLSETTYAGYDRLIQLCDALALPSGYCLMEVRLVDVALRHGVNEYTVQRWEGYLSLLREVEEIIGRSVYSLLPGVVENTFGRA